MLIVRFHTRLSRVIFVTALVLPVELGGTIAFGAGKKNRSARKLSRTLMTLEIESFSSASETNRQMPSCLTISGDFDLLTIAVRSGKQVGPSY